MKKLAIVLASIVGLFLIVLLVLEFAIDLNSYKEQVRTPIQEALQRRVDIGNISHTVLQGIGAGIRDVTISNSPESEGPLLQVKELVAKVKLLPLLSKKISLSKVMVDSPVLVLKRNQEGLWNIRDLLGTPVEASPPQSPTEEDAAPDEKPEGSSIPGTGVEEQPKTAEPPSEPSAPVPDLSQFSLDSFRLNDGTIQIVDDFLDIRTEFNDIKGRVDDVAVNSPVKFEISAAINQGEQGNFEAKGKVGPIPADGRFEEMDVELSADLSQIDLAHFTPYYQVAQLQEHLPDNERLDAKVNVSGNMATQLASAAELKVGEVQVEVEGTVDEPATAPKLDLRISTQELPWENLIQLLPPDIAKPLQDLGLSGLGNLTIEPKGPLNDLGISGEFDLSKSGIRFQEIFDKPEAVTTRLEFDLRLKQESLAIDMLKLSLGELELDIRGNVLNFAKPELDLRLSSNAFPIDDLLARFPAVGQINAKEELLKAGGKSTLQLSAKGALDDLAFEALLNLDENELVYGNFFQKDAKTPGNLQLSARLGENSLEVRTLTLNVGSFQLNSSGSLSDFKNPSLDFELESNEFDVAALFAHSPVVTEEYLPKELSLGGLTTLRLAPSGPLDKLTITGSLDMSKGEIIFENYFTKPKDIPAVIQFETTVAPDLVDIRKFNININGVLFDISGQISGLQQEAMLDLSLDSNRFALNQFLPFSGMDMASSGATELHVSLRGPANRLDATSITAAQLLFEDVTFFVPQIEKPAKHLFAQIELEEQVLYIRSLSGQIGESVLKGDLTAAGVFSSPNIEFALHSPNFNLDEFLPPEEKSAAVSPFLFVTDTQSVPESDPLPPPSPEAAWQLDRITARGTLAIEQGQAKNVRFSDLSSDVLFQEQQLTIANLLFSLYNGDYTGRVELDLSQERPKYTFQSELVHVDANSVLSDGTSLDNVLYGLLFADASIQGQGTETEELVTFLSGSGNITINDGRFTTLDFWPQIAEIFEVVGSVGNSKEISQIGKDLRSFPPETHFSRFEGSFNLKNGNAGSSDLILEIPEQGMHIALLLDGTFGLDTSLDFLGKLRFAPESKYYPDMKKYFSDFKHVDGSIELPFPIPIGGTLLEPEISLDSLQKSMQTFAIEMAKHSIKSQLEDAAKSELEKVGKSLLKDLFQ
ncbi:MAG: AsmA family protein [bacterium]|nr:AsmA family protein [bacterium]